MKCPFFVFAYRNHENKNPAKYCLAKIAKLNTSKVIYSYLILKNMMATCRFSIIASIEQDFVELSTLFQQHFSFSLVAGLSFYWFVFIVFIIILPYTQSIHTKFKKKK